MSTKENRFKKTSKLNSLKLNSLKETLMFTLNMLSAHDGR